MGALLAQGQLVNSLTQKALRGSLFSIVARLITRGLDLAVLVVLARILGPPDFGLVAIATTVVTIADATLDLPVGSILTREPQLRDSHLHGAFTLSMGRGLFLELVAVAISFPISQAYHDKRLIILLPIVMLGSVFRGAISPALIFRLRDLKFGASFGIDVTGKVVGLAAGLLVAYLFRSYWSIVVISVLTPATMMVVSYGVAPYRPRIDLTEWSTFSAFLKWSSLAQAITAGNWQCDRLILGAFVPQTLLGRYSLAGNLASLPEQAILKPLSSPLLAAFANVADDAERLRRAYLTTNQLTSVLCVPIVVLLSSLATPLTTLLLGGAKWVGVAPLLAWLAIPVALTLPYSALPAAAMALGRTRVFATRSLAEFVVQLPLVFTMTLAFGVLGTLISRLVVATYVLVVSMLLARELLGISLKEQARYFSPPMVSGSIMLVMLVFLQHWQNWDPRPTREILQVVRFAIAGAISYSLPLVLLLKVISGVDVRSFVSAEAGGLRLRFRRQDQTT